MNFQKLSKSSRNGDIAELMVITHYLNEGWEAFPNASCKGPIDLIIVNPVTNETFFIDVKSKDVWDRSKTTGLPNNYRVKPTELQRKLGVKFVYVERSTGSIHEGF